MKQQLLQLDPIEGTYKVQGPDGKEYQLKQKILGDTAAYFILENEVEKGMFHKINEASTSGVIFLYNEQKDNLKSVANFKQINNSYAVMLDYDDGGEEIHPLDFVLRELAKKK